MGAAMSWQDGGDASTRERSLELMKKAVQLRRCLAASHAAYLRSLRAVASALTRFAADGESIPVSDRTAPAVIRYQPILPPSPPPPLLLLIERRQSYEGSCCTQGVKEEKVRHRTLTAVAAGLEDYFIKAAIAGDAVSSQLENHAGGWIKQVLAGGRFQSAPSYDRLDSMSGRQRHSSTLKRLLTREKKLYKDTKERERLQEEEDEAIKQQHDKQIEETSSAIADLRDTQLARQLLELCHSTLDMWRSMQQHHEAQSVIAQQLSGLCLSTEKPTTTKAHHKATRALETAMTDWCDAMGRLAQHQRDYVHAVHGWLKLTLTPPENQVPSELAAFVDRWKLVFDRVQVQSKCGEVLELIKSFADAVRELYGLQSHELKVARREGRYSRELDRKSRKVDNKSSRSSSRYHEGWGFSSFWPWRQDVRRHEESAEVAACRKKMEDEMRRHDKAIDATRSAVLRTVQGKLPAVFQAMATFSETLAGELDDACKAPLMNTS